jgi:hypothetical protein
MRSSADRLLILSLYYVHEKKKKERYCVFKTAYVSNLLPPVNVDLCSLCFILFSLINSAVDLSNFFLYSNRSSSFLKMLQSDQHWHNEIEDFYSYFHSFTKYELPLQVSLPPLKWTNDSPRQDRLQKVFKYQMSFNKKFGPS